MTWTKKIYFLHSDNVTTVLNKNFFDKILKQTRKPWTTNRAKHWRIEIWQNSQCRINTNETTEHFVFYFLTKWRTQLGG